MKMDRTTVQIKSAWLSKINWTQFVAMIAMFGTMSGLFDMPPDMQANFLAGIVFVQGVVTWVMKTWFTDTVTPGATKP
jgi:hypothetical protein